MILAVTRSRDWQDGWLQSFQSKPLRLNSDTALRQAGFRGGSDAPGAEHNRGQQAENPDIPGTDSGRRGNAEEEYFFTKETPP